MNNYYLRKISKKKWPDNCLLCEVVNKIPADPLTRDMNSANNTFSLWKFGESEIDDGAITIALSNERLDNIDIVYLCKDEIESDGLVLKSSTGQTDYEVNSNKHFDIINMDYESLGKVASLIIKSIEDGLVVKYTKRELKEMINQKIKSGLLEYNKIKDKIKNELRDPAAEV